MSDTAAPEADSQSAITFLRELIAAQPRGEHAVQQVIGARLAQAGCKVSRHHYDPASVPMKGEFAADSSRNPEQRSAVVGTLEGRDDLPSLLIFAHPDGEPVTDADQWTHDAFAGEIDGGRLYGWGVADDLAGCAAAVLAIEAAAASGRPMGRAVFASTPSKRYARGVAALLHDGLTADAALYLHPAESGVGMREIKALASGQLEFRITVTGQAPDTTEPGQTAFSHLAANPVDKAILIHGALMALAEDRARRIRQPQIEARVGRATNLHISRIQCGQMTKLARIADECVMGGALSFPPGETLAEVQAEVEAAVARACEADDWLRAHPPRIDWLTGVTGAHVPEEHPLFQVTARSVREVTGEQPYVNAMHTSSDIRNPPVEAGIPCVAFGCLCGDLSQNEKRDEWVDVADFLRMVDVTTRVVTGWCGGAGKP
ncbi:M20 family metallopeptidase [Tropicimonas sediminicola]|uniref:Acetylornithine deacetylase n=1 Tax=Tropicimonas sediminicola TaxID=1031541 RepID=A0A239F422_9RHOB|nr:M20/M25/M40 family metallo-hydrolase [Tropicimonas sediminicola]SNS50854.1 acetylornithine deacetylase [Tropicimonas sediminicola]